jgi:uncharacterized phiE125 gp8 family phage protein
VEVVVTTPPSELPVTLEEAKKYLKIDFDNEDQLIIRLIQSVTDASEKYTGLSFITKTLTVYGDNWTCEELPYGPHQSITSVVRVNYDDTETALTPDEYSQTGLKYLTVKCGKSFKISTPWSERNRMKITYVAGFGDQSQVPDGIKVAILKEVAELYENRENTLVGTIVADLSTTSKTLLYQYKRNVLV